MPGSFLRRYILPVLFAACMVQAASAATTLNLEVLKGGYFTPQVEPKEGVAVPVGETFTLIVNVPNAKVSHSVTLPPVAGLTLNGTGTNPYQPHVTALNFFVTPARKGNLVIPAFDFRADDGQVFHVNSLTIRAGG